MTVNLCILVKLTKGHKIQLYIYINTAGFCDRLSISPKYINSLYLYIYQIVQRFFINAVHFFSSNYCFYVKKNVDQN